MVVAGDGWWWWWWWWWEVTGGHGWLQRLVSAHRFWCGLANLVL